LHLLLFPGNFVRELASGNTGADGGKGKCGGKVGKKWRQAKNQGVEPERKE
jgi:hypothetical protein